MAISWISIEDLDLNYQDNPDAPYAIEFASWILYKLTAEKYPGVQEAKEWYGIRRDEGSCKDLLADLTMNSVTPHFVSLGRTGGNKKVLRLRRKPVIDILEIEDYATGEALDPSTYDLRNYSFLNKKNGIWNLTGEGYIVTYLYGMNPPEPGKRAALKLTQEVIKSISDPGNCELPDRVTSISRQGVNYTIMDPQEFINDGKLGIYEVDIFINAANPAKALKRPRLVVPGLPQGETIR